MKIKIIVTGFFFFTLTLLATGAKAGALTFELVDHSRGIKISTASLEWSLNASKHSISLNNSKLKGRLSIRSEYRRMDSSSAAMKNNMTSLKRIKPGAKITKDNEKFKIGGNAEAVGYTHNDPGRLTTEMRIWFRSKGAQYIATCNAKDQFFKAVKKECIEILSSMEIIP